MKVKCDPCNKCTHFYFIKISPLKFNESLFFIQHCSAKVLLFDTHPFVEQLVPGLRLDHHRVSRLLEPHRMEVHRHAGINDTKKYLSRQQKIFFTNIKIFLTQSKLRPQKFYGVSRRNVETKVEVPDAQEDDEDTTEEAEKNRIIL